jgi:predicted O-linked N-acetylglucosamine transferase (SPINDLY family)
MPPEDHKTGRAETVAGDVPLAFAHHLAGRRAEAEGICRRVLEREPRHAGALQLLGLMAQQQGRLKVALRLMLMAVAADAGVADFHNSLGTVLADLRRFDAALAALDQALRLRPGYAQAHRNRGIALAKAGRLAEAAGPLREAARLRPDDPAAWEDLVSLYHQLGDAPAMIECRRRIAALRTDDPAALGELLVTLHYSPDYSPGRLLEEHREWSRKFEGSAASRGSAQTATASETAARPGADWREWNVRPPSRSGARALRVGYVSGDFREHPAARFVLPVLKAHDRGRVKVVCYSDVGRPLASEIATQADRQTQRFREAADLWRDSASWSDERLAEAVRADRIDVLVDLAGHLDSRRLTAFALRPAPVQVGYFGYPGTTGTSCIGWRITDEWHDPPGAAERFYTEKLIRIPGGCWCYDAGDEGNRPVAALPALARGHVTFAVFNRLIKVTSMMMRLWAQVLERTPGSRLAVIGSAGEGGDRAAADLLARNGVDPARIIVLPRRSRREYLGYCDGVDIALDTFPYAGMTTTCDAMWMGVPTVTLAGDSAVSRTGMSLLAAARLPELIARTPGEYVETAVKLADDPEGLASLRQALRDGMKASPLADAGRVARALEAAYGAGGGDIAGGLPGR